MGLQADRGGDGYVRTLWHSGAGHAGEWDHFHVESQGLKPDERVGGEVKEAAQAQRLGHQAEVLQDRPLLDGDELTNPGFHAADGREAAVLDIVVQDPAAGAGEAIDACRPEPVALVHDEVGELLAKGGKQQIEVEGAELVDRQEVGRTSDVGHPLVEGRDVRQRPGHVQASAGQAQAAPAR